MGEGGGGGNRRPCLGALSLRQGKKMGPQVVLEVLLSEQTRNNVLVLAREGYVGENEMVGGK